VRFVGAVLGSQFRALVQHAEVFVLPSELEGLSTGLLEAMAAARCIIATNLPENIEAVGDAGLLVPPGDPAALAAALDTALSCAQERQRLGNAAQRRAVGLYDWERTTNQFEQVYEHVR
jgi:glycosyltransferase involved in cell wall biosynthesis